jgi:hypothetical protein
MLRITASETPDRQKWILCGQLAGPWVAEFKSSWDQATQHSNSVIYLTDVTFVDDEGVRLLLTMKAAGAQFVARGVDTKHLLEDLKRKTAPPLRRCLSWLASDACRKDGR